MSLSEAIFKIQSEVSKVHKGQTNPHFKQKYATLESVLDVLNPHLKDNGVVVVQKCGLIENGGTQLVLITELTKDKESEEFFTPLFGIESAKNPMQALGSAMTYARRYALMGYFKLAPTDDDANSVEKDKPKPKSSFVPSAFLKAIEKLGRTKEDAENLIEKKFEDRSTADEAVLRQWYLELNKGEKK